MRNEIFSNQGGCAYDSALARAAPSSLSAE